MKKVFLVIVAAFLSASAFSADVLVLNNEQVFEGKVVRVKSCEVVFKVDNEKYQIPAEDIAYLQFENVKSRILKNYNKMQDPNKCLLGRLDAANHHGKTGLNVALGVLFGPFAVIGAALTNPGPEKGKDTMAMSKNSELFDDPMYLSCYKKKAKGKNVGNAAMGWGAWVLLLLLL